MTEARRRGPADLAQVIGPLAGSHKTQPGQGIAAGLCHGARGGLTEERSSGLATKLLVAVEPKRHDLRNATLLHRHTVQDIRCQHRLTVMRHDQEL